MTKHSVTDDEREAAHALIVKLVRREEYQTALAFCSECLENWPDDKSHFAWHNLSYVQNSMGSPDQAMSSLSKAVSLAPDDPAHRDARARLAICEKDYDVAINDSSALIEIELKRETRAFLESAFLLRAFAYLHLSEPDKALADLGRVNDPGPFRVARRNWMKDELISAAQNREALE